MTLNSTTSDSSSILSGGKLKPGIYKIQNLSAQTYMDVHEHLREKWEIKPLGAGYSVRRVEPGKPDQFCFPLRGVGNGVKHLCLAPYPVAWKIEIVQDEAHRGFEYVRVRWGSTNIMWDLDGAGCRADGTRVWVYDDGHGKGAWRIWKLIPQNIEGAFAPSRSSSETPGSGSLPPYDGDTTGQSSTRDRHTETESDEFGTIVNEVTVLTTTVTTRRRYRVEDV